MVILSLFSAETPSAILHLALRSPVQDRNGPIKAGTEEGYKNDRSLEHLSPVKKSKELGVALSGEEKAGETILQSFKI